MVVRTLGITQSRALLRESRSTQTVFKASELNLSISLGVTSAVEFSEIGEIYDRLQDAVVGLGAGRGSDVYLN